MMRKKCAFLSAMLVLALFGSRIPPARAAEGENGKLNMEASGSAIADGGTVTVTLSADTAMTLRGSGVTVTYDDQVLEPVPERCQAAEPFTVSTPLSVQGKQALRVSFLPGTEGHTFAPNQEIAELTFRAIAPAEETAVNVKAAYFYNGNLNPIPLTMPQPVKVYIAAIPVTGITLSPANMSLEIGESRSLMATVTPANASDKTIRWTSSEESVVTVENGRLTGVAIGEAAITAQAGDHTATCQVEVVYPPDAGYVVNMPGEQQAVVGDTVTISPVIDNGEPEAVAVFNAYDITLTYDPDKLKLQTRELEGTTVTTGNGKVTLLHYGADQDIGTSPFALTFQTLQTGETEVRVTAARVDHSENATMKNAAKASLYPETTKITVGGYPVSLPDDFTGDVVVEPGESYTFAARDPYYDFTFEGSTMGGEDVEVKDNGNGTYTVETVTGRLDIRSEKTGKTFDVVFDGTGKSDIQGASTARYRTDYTATLQEDENHRYSVHISIGGNGYNGYSYDRETNTYTIPGEDIKGKIIFTVTKTSVDTPPPPTVYYNVRFEGNGAADAGSYTGSTVAGSTYRFTLNKETGYRYAVSYTMGGGQKKTVRPGEDGTYSIPNVQGDLVITVTKAKDEDNMRVEVHAYLTLPEGRTMYLVLVHGMPDDSSVYAYAGEPMYYSGVYEAWCTLTVQEALTAREAGKLVSVLEGSMVTIGSAEFDVNMTGLVDINDAQLVYDLYNGIYGDFETINMHRFLNADVNADRKITVTDAAAVVANIK